MKWIIASDIHGSESACEKLFAAMDREKAEKLLLLGDLLSGGLFPNERTAELLNSRARSIRAVAGNCDGSSAEKLLDFELSDSTLIWSGGLLICATHGHIYSEGFLPPVSGIQVMLCGHTHIPAFHNNGSYYYMNPGSTNRPRGGSEAGYMTMEERTFCWKKMDGSELRAVTL